MIIGGEMKFLNTQIQIRPCIVSKARYALGLKSHFPKQNVIQNCKIDYWKNTIDTICTLNNIKDQKQKNKANKLYEKLNSNKAS